MGFYVGIDLGTTNSTVSVIRTKNLDDSPLETLTTCPIYQYGEHVGETVSEVCLPSALYFDVDNRRVYTGRFAKSVYASGERPLQTAMSIKTRMGGDSRLEIPSISGRSKSEFFDMKECASFFIRTIVESLKKQYPEITNLTEECVVTVPAAFNDDERVATKNAVLLGGFKNCTILDEPTAALLSYINSEAYNDEDDDQDTIYKLVYDIGGGTLDVSIAKLTRDDYGGYTVDIVGLSERMNLGGDNFDRLLGAYFLKEFEATNKPIQTHSKEDQGRIIALIISRAEYYKIDLNEKILAKLDKPRLLNMIKSIVSFQLIDGMYVNGVVLKKEHMDDLFACYTSEREMKFGLLAPIRMALRQSNLRKEDISEVILTGGMSTFYAVHETLSKFFGDVPMNVVDDTRTAVSRGAALYHWSLDENNVAEDVRKISRISNKLASNIYVRNADGKFELLIPSDLSKKSGTFLYTIAEDDLAFLPFYLYSGSESINGEDNTSTYTQLTGRMIKAKPEYKKGSKIPISWSIDDNKVITIQLQDDKDIKLSRLLTREEIAQSVVGNYRVNWS
jgi:molecular chaperone DnaK